MIRIEGVQANGHSPNPVIRYQVKNGRITEIKYGQSLIEWQAVTGATRYKIIYNLVHASPDDLPDEHSLPAPATSTNLRGIIIEELYELRVEAYRGNTLIGRSNTILVFATDNTFEIRVIDPLRKVAGIPLGGYLKENLVDSPIGHFDYILCDTTLPYDDTNPLPSADTDTDDPDTEELSEFEKAKKQIEDGIKIWVDRSSSMVSYYQELESNLEEEDPNPCDKIEKALATSDPEDDNNVARFIYALIPRDLRRVCSNDNAGGCHKAVKVISGPERGRLYKGRVFLKNDLSVANSCSELLQVVIHEAGHIFGLSDVDARINTIMYERTTGICELTNRDIVAIKAIYQSRNGEG